MLRKTRYRYGARALASPLMVIAGILFMLGVSIWGSFQVSGLTRNIAPCSEQQKLELGQPE